DDALELAFVDVAAGRLVGADVGGAHGIGCVATLDGACAYLRNFRRCFHVLAVLGDGLVTDAQVTSDGGICLAYCTGVFEGGTDGPLFVGLGAAQAMGLVGGISAPLGLGLGALVDDGGHG